MFMSRACFLGPKKRHIVIEFWMDVADTEVSLYSETVVIKNVVSSQLVTQIFNLRRILLSSIHLREGIPRVRPRHAARSRL